MDDHSQAGYHEIPHTADWKLEVWAPDLPGLLEQAARGMAALAGARQEAGPSRPVRLRLEASDPERLLVSFLSELLYLGESEGLVFQKFDLALKDGWLEASLDGMPLSGVDKEIKAVTYHNLKIRSSPRGLETEIVFDV